MSKLLQNVYDNDISKGNFQLKYADIKKKFDTMVKTYKKRATSKRQVILDLAHGFIKIFE